MLRASDADRDAVIDRLRAAASEGRLDTGELDERLDAALRARTYGELEPLLGDIPSRAPLPWRRPRSQVVPVAQRSFAVALPLLTTVAVVAVVVTIAAVAAAWWLMWALVWFFMCGRGSCSPRRLSARTARPRSPRPI